MTRAQALLDSLVAEIERSGFGAHGLHVRVAADGVERRWTPDEREEIHSVAKAVCVIAVGMAADEGLVDVDAPVAASLPTFRFGEGADEVTLRHLLSMTSGIDLPWSETMMTDWPDLAREFLGRPSRGRVFQYSNASTYAGMRALAAVVGDVETWLRPRLFAPLGWNDVAWRRCPNGFVLAGEGIALRTSELARLGLLIRDRGAWRGRRLLSAEWIDAMHTGWVAAGTHPGYERYALGGWDGPGPGWRLHGANGQLLLFAGDAVITVTADDHFGAGDLAAFAMRAAAEASHA